MDTNRLKRFGERLRRLWGVGPLMRLWRLLVYTARGFREHDTLVRSAALTLYTLMSLVPLAAIALAVVKGFGAADRLMENLYGVFPRNPEIVDYLIDFADKAIARTQGGLLAAVALVMLFWSAVSVFVSVEGAFNKIWEVRTERKLLRQLPAYVAVVMIVPLLWVAANAIGSHAQQTLSVDAPRIYGLLSRVASMVVIWGMFAVLYVALPNTKVRPASALKAAIVAGTAFLAFQWGYVWVQKWMTSYNAIYGSLAALPLLLIWLQCSWLILLVGGELSFAYQHIARFCQERESLHISHEQRRKVMLAVVLAVVGHLRDRGGAISAEEIRGRLDLPVRIVNDVLDRLVRGGQLLAVACGGDDYGEAYVPARDISTMTLCGVLAEVESAGESRVDFAASVELEHVDRELDRMRRQLLEAPDNVRIVELLDRCRAGAADRAE